MRLTSSRLRSALLTAVLLLPVLASAQGGQQAIARRWKLDPASVVALRLYMIENLKKTNPAEAEAAEANPAPLEATLAGTVLEYRADGTSKRTIPGFPESSGTWTLSVDGKLLTTVSDGRTTLVDIQSLTPEKFVGRQQKPNYPWVTYVPAE